VCVFEEFGIDHCYGGKRSREEACRQANIPFAVVLEQLSTVKEQASGEDADCTLASVYGLAGHIIEHHHGYIRRESSRLISLLQKAATRYGAAHPELKSIQELFRALVDEMFTHMMTEESVLFPNLVKMEEAASQGRPTSPVLFGSVDAAISRMLAIMTMRAR
jgi:regulator of cell morphogenesis and NO signaling